MRGQASIAPTVRLLRFSAPAALFLSWGVVWLTVGVVAFASGLSQARPQQALLIARVNAHNMVSKGGARYCCETFDLRVAHSVPVEAVLPLAAALTGAAVIAVAWFVWTREARARERLSKLGLLPVVFLFLYAFDLRKQSGACLGLGDEGCLVSLQSVTDAFSLATIAFLILALTLIGSAVGWERLRRLVDA